MRKFWVAGTAAMLVLALAAVSVAQSPVVNEYTVQASLSPSKPGSKKKPLPVSVNFDYTVGANEDYRPIPVQKYSIQFSGLRVTTKAAGTCQTEKLEQEGLAGCKPNSIVGGGYIDNATGIREDPRSRSISCPAKVTVVNEHPNKANLFIEGNPQHPDPKARCQITLPRIAIAANYVRTASGTNLEFTVPPSLLHPTPGTTNAVQRVQSKIKRITKKISGKTVGYYSVVGGCKNKSRSVTVVFTPEEGPTGRAQDKAPCR
jgi:hypothetical protein